MKQTIALGVITAWLACLVSAQAGNVQIHVQDVPVRTVLEGLARSNQMNLIIDDTVTGTLTMHVDNVDAETALQAIIASQGLLCQQSGTMRTIIGKARENQPKQYYTWHLQYASPLAMAEAVRAILPEKEVKGYGDTNTLVVGGTWHDAAAVEKLVQQLDKAPQQVKVEAQIISLDRNALKQHGVEWNWSPVEGGSGHGVFSFAGQIQALEEKGKARILARPHMTAVNGKKAHILIGDKIPVVTEHMASGEKTSTIEYEEAGIKLTYVPQIHGDGSVSAAIEAEVSTPVYVPELKAYRIATRQAQTSVRMRPHETLVIGGLIRKEDVENFRKIPLLGDLPLLGKLFRSRYVSAKETEVLILLQAHVVPDTEEEEETFKNFTIR